MKDRDYTMESLYNIIGYSRQGISQYMDRGNKRAEVESRVLEQARKWREELPGFSARTLYYSIKNQGEEIEVGINKFEKIISKAGLNVQKAPTRIPKTSDGKGKGSYENLINGLIINDINQLIVGDITYYIVGEKTYYIFSLKDVYSQRILGLVPSERLFAKHAFECLEQAIQLRGEDKLKSAIHHSDNGSQYEWKRYISKLDELGMKISRAQNCLQNGSAEQLNDIIKNRFLMPWGVTNLEELRKACDKLKYHNNELRSIKQLGNMSPNQFESMIKNIDIDQRIKLRMHDFTTN